MFGIDAGHVTAHKESSMASQKQDTQAKNRVTMKLGTFGVFSDETIDEPVNIATKAQVTDKTKEYLIDVENMGKIEVQTYTHESLLPPHEGSIHKKFHHPMKRCNPATFAKL